MSQRRWCIEPARARRDQILELPSVILDVSPVPMWLADGETLRFTEASEAAIRQYGYTRDEFLALTILDLLPPDDVEAARQTLAGATVDAVRHASWRHRRNDGSILEVDVTLRALMVGGRDAWLMSATDVTRWRQAEAELRRSNEFIRTLVASAPLAILALDSDARIVLWNPAAEAMFGWTAEEVLGHRSPLLPDEERAAAWAFVDRLHEQGAVTDVEARRLRKDGSSVRVSISAALLRDARGAPSGYVALVADLTDRVQLEEQLRQAQKMEAIGRLAGGIAHDFNNLLTVISSYAGLLDADLAAGDERREHVEEIRSAAARATALTRQLLAFSRKQVLVPRVLSVNDVIGGIEQMLRRLTPTDIELVLTLRPGIGAVRVDAGQVEQVIMNLVINAADAMPSGGRIAIETSEVLLDADYARHHSDAMPGTYACVSVSDTGHGMDAQTRAHLFEPFFTTKPTGKGTGLGLATVYGIVRQSQGHVTVYSEPGEGTTFRVYLPVVDARPIERRSEAEGAPRGTETILLVDDDQAVRETLRRLLTRLGYTVLSASDADDALRAAAAHAGAVDLVLTDLLMPGGGGRQLIERLRNAGHLTRVLLMSGYTDDEVLRRGLRHADYPFVQKPFSLDELARRVREVLDAAPISGSA